MWRRCGVRGRLAINCVAFLMGCCSVFGEPHRDDARDLLKRPATLRASKGVAIGDSLALGFGQASGLETHAVVGEPSCPHGQWPGIVNMVPSKHLSFLLISAGTNDMPGKCIEQIRAKANADAVMWV